MGPARDHEGAASRGRLQRFLPRRRSSGEPVPDDAARTVASARPDEAAEPRREPLTRISAAEPVRAPREDATVGHDRPPSEPEERTVVDEPATTRADGRTVIDDPATTRPDDRTEVHGAGTPGAGGATAERAPAPAHDLERMRVPGFSPLAPVAGWLAAWGVAALAAQCFQEGGGELGQGLGIASANGAADGFWNGVWLLVIQAGAWIFGGYVAARMARGNGTRHAVLAWVLAMLATGADALTDVVRDGYTSVLAVIDIPSWIDTGLGDGADTAAVYAVFALVALVAAVVGGGIGQGANALARRRARA